VLRGLTYSVLVPLDVAERRMLARRPQGSVGFHGLRTLPRLVRVQGVLAILANSSVAPKWSLPQLHGQLDPLSSNSPTARRPRSRP